MKRFLLLLTCLLLLTGCTQARPKTYDEAVELFAAGQYAEAAAAFEQLGSKAAAPTYAAYSRGLVLYEQGQYAAAAPYFEKTQDFMYGRERYRYCSAHAALDAGQIQEAASGFLNLADFEDAPLWYEYCAARLAEENKDYENALYSYEAAGTLADAEDRLYNLRGQIYNRAIEYKKEGNYADAIILFTMLGDYLSAADQASQCKDVYLDGQYEQADFYEAAGDLQAAYDLFTGLAGYRDSAERAEQIAPLLGIEIENRDD